MVRIGIIGGSGLYEMDGVEKIRWAFLFIFHLLF